MKKTTIAVGMSGGVDSSVTAYLLKEQGFDVIGIFMKNWEEDDAADFCPAEIDAKDAEKVAKKLGIPFYTINFADEYWERVFAYFLEEYKAGRTPNPDILCNREIKFKAFLEYARTLGADFIATGHYAQKRDINGQFELLKAADLNKDQSYFLYALGQAQLARALFPIGALTKPQVREIAAAQGFDNHAKKDSTGICFIGERKFKDFLARYLPAQPGDIVTENNEIIGRHDGLMYYTIGQRQGLNIGGMKEGSGEPWYVAGKDLKTNCLLVVQNQAHPLLFKSDLTAQDVHFVAGAAPAANFNCTAKIRYRQTDQACEVRIDNSIAHVRFIEPQRAVTPGQSIVFYDGDICLGGGVIG